MARPSEKVADQNLSGRGRTYGQRSPEERRTDRRERLLAAALETFAHRGFPAVTIEQLCADAKVSTRTFYEEFAAKEDVLATLHDLLNERAMDAVVAAIGATDPNDVEARARAGCSAYFDVFTRDPRWARVALVESVGVSKEMEACRQAAVDRFASLLTSEADRLAAAGVLPVRDYSVTAIALVGAIKELVTSWATTRPRRNLADDLAAEAARLVAAALR